MMMPSILCRGSAMEKPSTERIGINSIRLSPQRKSGTVSQVVNALSGNALSPKAIE